MRFLADMGVSQKVVEWLRANGHNATHLRDEGLHQLKDSLIFDKAVSESRIVLTFDLDFGEIAALSGDHFMGVILFRLRNTRTPVVMARLQTVLKHAADQLEQGAVVIVEDSRHRVRMLPIR